MKKHVLTAAFLLLIANSIFAQELKTINYSTSEINDSQLSLSENWAAYIDQNVVTIYNGKIQNQSNSKAKNLNIELYLTPKGAEETAGVIQGYSLAKVPFKTIDKNSNLVGVHIKSDLTEVPPAGIYDPVLVLTDKNGKVLNYQNVHNSIESKDGVLAIYKVPVTPEGAVTAKPDLYPTVKMDIKEDNSVVLEKDWQVEVDFKNFMVKVIGGDITNKTDQDLNNLVLDVFLTKEEQTKIDSNFDAVHIASAELKKIEKFKKFVDTTISTNLTRIPETGTYHILLTLSVKDDKGNPVVRTKRAFLETISF
ncbi:hypothetical protein [Moheibacter lacus]|uniref:Uncharacterized protein n=1 Tax=Moheibacter lacus TaxID=2745851 RepID=A0A838ZU17_9FLAO|nr:hypothetical protein [Moheibacter lacus]MBA5630486.1 hypothetical protein [Moheibacter lacus]